MVERTINIEGDTIKLKFSNRAVRQIDRELGYSMMHVLEKVEKHGSMAPLSLDCLATILWGGMLHLNKGHSIDGVADMIPMKMSKYADLAMQMLSIIGEIYELDDLEIDMNNRDLEGKPGKASGAGPTQKK